MAVSIPIEFPGVELSEQQLAALLQVLDSLAVSEDRVRASTDQLAGANDRLKQSETDLLTSSQLAEARERGIAAARQDARERAIALAAAERGVTQARSEHAAATSALERAQDRATQQQMAASQGAIQFTQRIAGAANAVQSLVGQLGLSGHAAGLAGAVANSTAQFAQLGAAVGPQGALVGGIIGALIPAITHLRQASIDARTETQRLNADLATLISRASQAREQEALLRRLEGGQGTLDEQVGYQAQAQQRIQQLQDVLSGDQGAIRAFRAAGLSHRADTDPSLLDSAREAIGGAPAISLDSEERVMAQRLLQRAMREAEHRVDLITEVGDRAIDDANMAITARETAARRSGGGGASGGQRGNRGVRGVDDATLGAMLADQEAARAQEAEIQRRQQLAQMHDDAAAQYQQEIADRRTLIDLTRQQDVAEAEATADRKSREEEELGRLNARKRAQEQAAQQQIAGYEQHTGVIVNGIVQAGVALASGQESASQAFKHLLAGFLEMISQRAALSAAEQYALAIASFASEDYGGGALHAAAGVAFTGVAIAAGAGGAILNSSAAQEGRGASAGGGPARPPSSSRGGTGEGGGTTNIYFNSPVITASTEAELARNLRRMTQQSERRYPTG